MSLPPDPHDDDLAGVSIPPTPPPPPDNPAAPDPSRTADPTPESPASATPAAAPGAAPTPGTATLAAPSPPAAPPAPPGAESASASAAAGDPARAGSPAGADGKRRLGLLLGGVAAVLAVAGIAVVATGGSDDTDAAEPAADESTGSADGSGADPDSDETAGAGDEDAVDGAGGAAPSASGDSPVEVAEEFFDAVADADCADVIALMTPESYNRDGATAAEAVAECENDPAGAAMISAADYDDVELVSQDGERATVRVTVTVDGGDAVQQIPLRRVDSEWKVDLDPTRAGTGG